MTRAELLGILGRYLVKSAATSAVTTSAANPADVYVDRVNAAVNDAVPFVKQHESFQPRAYRSVLGRDKAGNPIYDKWTIGYGQTEINGRPVVEGDTITERDAAKFVVRRLRQNAAALYKQNPWTQRLSQGALSALYDTAYNVGSGTFSVAKSPNLNRRMAAATSGHDAILRSELPTYVRAGGIKLRGLVNRRNEAIRKWVPGPNPVK